MTQRATDKPIIYRCFLCTKPFQFGPQAYHGKHIRQWAIEVCSQCYAANHDGIVSEENPRLLEHLNTMGVKVQLNDKGYIDWPPP